MANDIKTITMLTLPDGIPTGSGANRPIEPWSGTSSSFQLTDAIASQVKVLDDDDTFDTLRYQSDTMQTLVSDTVFGHGPTQTMLPAGTQVSHYAGAIIEDETTGQRFVVTFTRNAVANTMDGIVGGMTSVFVIPEDPDGPEINLSGSFRYVGSFRIGAGYPGVSYARDPSATCFTSGTLISTGTGRRKIETLQPGDSVLTHDHGLQQIRWIGSTGLDPGTLDQHPNLRPIRIRAGALGPSIPATDLTVSPQHRVLIRSQIAMRMFNTPEVLVAAKHLISFDGIVPVRPDNGVTYMHLLFDRHEVIMSNGAWSESLFTGPQALAAMPPSARAEIRALFPEICEPGFHAKPAKHLLGGREGRKLAERHAKNAKALFMPA